MPVLLCPYYVLCKLEGNDWPYPSAAALNSFFKVQIVAFINVFRKVYFVIAIIVMVSIYTQLMSGS